MDSFMDLQVTSLSESFVTMQAFEVFLLYESSDAFLSYLAYRNFSHNHYRGTVFLPCEFSDELGRK